jgi:hypothetical protein
MKKVLLSVAVATTFAFTSCGGSPSVCDCLKNSEKGAEADMKMAENCLKMNEGKTQEEQMKMLEEAANCK